MIRWRLEDLCNRLEVVRWGCHVRWVSIDILRRIVEVIDCFLAEGGDIKKDEEKKDFEEDKINNKKMFLSIVEKQLDREEERREQVTKNASTMITLITGVIIYMSTFVDIPEWRFNYYGAGEWVTLILTLFSIMFLMVSLFFYVRVLSGSGYKSVNITHENMEGVEDWDVSQSDFMKLFIDRSLDALKYNNKKIDKMYENIKIANKLLFVSSVAIIVIGVF